MTDYFDFRHPAFAQPPKLHNAPGLSAGLAKCKAAGFNPPLPGSSGSGPSALSRSLARAVKAS
jgi:hypothetical protein